MREETITFQMRDPYPNIMKGPPSAMMEFEKTRCDEVVRWQETDRGHRCIHLPLLKIDCRKIPVGAYVAVCEAPNRRRSLKKPENCA